MYFICFFVTLLGILSFLLAILFSFTTMAGYFGCEYIRTGLSSPQDFTQNFDVIISNQELTSQLSVCVESGTGNIVEIIVGNDVYALLSSLRDLSVNLDEFNSSSLLEVYSQTYSTLPQTIESFERAQVLDIDSQVDISTLERLSNAANYQCSTVGFGDDSWIPSISQNPVYVTCKSADGLNFTSSTCADITSRNTGCVGCADTYDIF